MRFGSLHLCKIALLAALVALTACATLPPDQIALAKRDAKTADIERTASMRDATWPDAAWWKRYSDTQLNGLIERALTDAPSMATAEARVHLAERSADAARAELGANLGLNAALTREKLSHNGLIPPPYAGTTINDAEVSLGFAYDFDWWGKNRATLAATIDEERAAEADRAAATLLLTSAVAQQYFAWQAAGARVALALESLDQREQAVRLLKMRLDRGLESSGSVDQAKVQRDSDQEYLLAMKLNQQLIREQLRALLGAAPGTLPELTAMPLPSEETAIPSQLGLDLLARRPDVEASRLRVEAQTRRIDAAKAEFYPDININAFLGLSSVKLGKLLNSDSLTTGITPALHLPLFDAGRLRANLGITRADLDLAIATYNQTVADAASDVSIQVVALSGIAAQRQAAVASVHASEAVKANAQSRLHQGLIDGLDTIAAELPLIEQRDVVLQLDAQQLGTQIALIKALGGGYHTQSSTVSTVRTTE
jgi:outer membrane protein, multidrug efflux system